MRSFELGYRAVSSSPRVPLQLRSLHSQIVLPSTFGKLEMFTNEAVVSFLLKSHLPLLFDRQMSLTGAAPMLVFLA